MILPIHLGWYEDEVTMYYHILKNNTMNVQCSKIYNRIFFKGTNPQLKTKSYNRAIPLSLLRMFQEIINKTIPNPIELRIKLR